VEHLQLDVELYSIRARVNELYFGVLLMEEQHRITALRKKDLSSALAKINAMVLNGTAIRSSAASLEAELLKVDQRLVEIESGADAYRTMLGRFINEQIGPDTRLERAVFEPPPDVIERQELRVFDAQRRLIEANKSMLAARRKPRLELFIQGGYGRPGLNMLKNEFDLYYLGGLRFTWLLSAYYTAKKEEQLLSLRQQSIDVQRETFLFNTAIQLSEYESEINKLLKLTEVDHRIIRLRTEVRETARAQLDEGVITSSDFIREVNAEDQAKQDLALHQTQLLLAQARYHFASGH
jgi:outer membrane protein TolC